jgi:hypothetical protein
LPPGKPKTGLQRATKEKLNSTKENKATHLPPGEPKTCLQRPPKEKPSSTEEKKATQHVDTKQLFVILISFTDCPSALLVAADSMKKRTQDAPHSREWDEEDGSFCPRTSSVQSIVFLLLTIFVSFANKIVSSMAGCWG